jgi:glycosyltransferase involved in cell wall biosynthesis
VLYYGSMLPLHGLHVVLEAARALAGDARISFTFVGGGADDARRIDDARAAGAHVTHRLWVPYAELPALFGEHDLMLGGPFGDTTQARFVITGKTYQFLACALPTVVGENLESGVFADRSDALVVRLGDSGGLAAAIEWAADHADELGSIGRRGRELYERLFSVERIAVELRAALRAEHPADVEDAGDHEE